jgi:hypothetical protein
MSGRSNACSELVRFWLQERHGCLIDDELPVPVPYALSDIDLVAMRADLMPFSLPDGTQIGPRVIVEAKAEHDWDVTGREFGAALRNDVELMGDQMSIPLDTRGVKFVMLRQQHFERAENYFGTNDFDRLFVVHALDPQVRSDLAAALAVRRIFWLTIPELLADIYEWYQRHPRRAALRRSPTGDLLHLLFGLCGFSPPSSPR